MLDESRRIRNQIRRSYHGPAWHGPCLKEALSGVTHTHALLHPLPAAHSIWELVLHLTSWMETVRRRVRGEFLEVADGADWPPVNMATEQQWQSAIAALEKAECGLEEASGHLTDVALADFVPGCNYTNYFMLMGVIQHNVYHAGQIMLLRRAVR